jgi:hypothetical protein
VLSAQCWQRGWPQGNTLRSEGTDLAADRGTVAPSLSHRPRRPEQGALHQIVREHYETFRAQAAGASAPGPAVTIATTAAV